MLGFLSHEIGAITIKKGKFEQPRKPIVDLPFMETEDATMVLPKVPAAKPSVTPPPAPKPQPPVEEPKKGLSRGLLAAIIAGAVVLAILIGMFVWGLVLKAGDTIYPNVYLAGINVGGMDRNTAMATVEQAVSDSYASSVLNVQLPDRTLSFQPEQTKVALEPEEAIAEAMSYGRSGNPFSAVTTFWASKNREHYVDLQTVLNLDTDYIRQMIDAMAAEVESDPTPHKVTVNEQAETIVVEVGSPDRSLDADALYEAVYQAFMDRNFTPLKWEYDEVPCQPVDLEGLMERFGTPAEDAVYDEEAGIITEEVIGYGFDIEEEAKRIEEAAPGSKLIIKMGELVPEVTKADINSEYFGTKLYSKSSVYVVNADRTNNLKLACEAINGKIIAPGQVFSFNDTVGERTAEKGYKAATVYSGGESIPELGGGVCQVASTIYYATLHMDLEQVERTEHMFVVTYVDMGMDATIYWGSLDYKFRNTLDYPIKIQANIDDGSCNITFWGEKPLDKKVEMSYSILSTTPWEEVEEVDETKEPGFREEKCTPYTGYKVVTYKKVFDLDGNELSSGVEAYSTYEKRDHIFIVGPSEEKPMDPSDPNNPMFPEDPLAPDDPLSGTPDTENPGLNDPFNNPWGIY